MKLFLPKRIPLSYSIAFVTTLAVIELVEGTTPLMVAAVAIYLFTAVAAFNVAGGLLYPSGWWVAANAVLTVGVGLVLKAGLGEAAQTNVVNAEKTMILYAAGEAGILAAVYLTRRFRRRKGFLENSLPNANLVQISFGLFLCGVVPAYTFSGAIGSAFGQVNNFAFLAILVAVYLKVKRTDGYKSFVFPSFVSWAFLTFFWGVLAFSKQGMFAPTVAWLVAAVAGGYRISPARALIVVCAVAGAAVLLTPVSQLGRNAYLDPKYSGRTDAALDILLHPTQAREADAYLAAMEDRGARASGYFWFNERMGLLDRLNIFAVDAALIRVTDEGHPASLANVWTYFVNVVPHFLYPNKPDLRWGNIYAHEIGLLGDEDETTGISFSPLADAYHTGEWTGAVLVMPLMALLLFLVADSVTGSIDRSPWGMLYAVIFTHTAPEGMLLQFVYSATYVTLGVFFASYICTGVAPFIGNLISPPASRVQELSKAGSYNQQSV